MSLEPFSKIELFASLEVPLGSQYGENVSTTLELCVGQGEDLTCDDITLKFISASITIDPPTGEWCLVMQTTPSVPQFHRGLIA